MLHAKSRPFYDGVAINLHYLNPTLPVLYRGLTGIILSLILCSAIVFSLYKLLKIIKKQKLLSDIKNDFIDNVTHEFKTPIATVSTAIEAIKKFNEDQINEKTKRYLTISEQQLNKLNSLVEKIMETALLEDTSLKLNKKSIDLIKLLNLCAEKHQFNTDKNIIVITNVKHITVDVDEFHFENAISNLIDNAIKYGGNEIKLSVRGETNRIQISVYDNGPGISAKDEPYLFDKFFRVKKDNIHTTKGFGIGLYYSKKIIEKHHGTIALQNKNTFTIELWRE